ncbi:MarR family winged helix-turn-helix transcriptional regulator [Microbacterium sp. ZW T5_56]|uniref:MarR family winged helix-turn-helix transcriptional regulator n=1 Tax=Microbacterium sp. ZW T5_56 TaxID=3378081 RepID=UPI00385464BE
MMESVTSEMDRPAAADVRTAAMRALESEFSGLIARMRHLYIEYANRVSPGMLPGTYKVFSIIARRGPITASAVGETLMMDKAQISRITRELSELGLLERTPDPKDGRASLLSASEEGQRRIRAAMDSGDNHLVRSLEDWDIADISRLTVLLHALGEGRPPAP